MSTQNLGSVLTHQAKALVHQASWIDFLCLRVVPGTECHTRGSRSVASDIHELNPTTIAIPGWSNNTVASIEEYYTSESVRSLGP